MSDDPRDDEDGRLPPEGDAESTAPARPGARAKDEAPDPVDHAQAEPPEDEAADEDDAPRLRPRVPVDAIEAAPADPMEVAAEQQRKGKIKWIALAIVGVLLAGGGVFAYLVNDAKGEEEERFASAEGLDTRDGWTRYLTWSRDLRQTGGLGAWFAINYTEIAAHQATAKQRILLDRARSAVATRNHAYLCHLREIGAGEDDAAIAEAIQSGLDERLERAVIRMTGLATARSTPPGIQVALTRALRQADACGGGPVRVGVSHEIAPAGFDDALPGGGGSVEDALEAIDLDALGTALLGELPGDLEELSSGLLHLPAADDEETAMEVGVAVTLVPHDRFVTPSGGSLPSVSLKVTTTVTGADAPYRGEETFHAPNSVALEFFRAEAEGAAGVYAHTVEALYPNVRAKLRQGLGLERFRIGATRIAFGCRNPELLVFDRVLRGETTRGSDFFIGSCLDLSDEDYYEGYMSDDELEEMARPERVHRLVVAERSRVAIEVVSDFTPQIYVRRDCSSAPSEVACVADDWVLEQTFDPGVYSVFVDTTEQGGYGEYGVYATVRTAEAEANACRAGTDLPTETLRVEGTTAQGEDRLHGTCGGIGSNERVYHLQVAERSRLRCELTGPGLGQRGNQAVLYWRTECGDAESERSCKIATTTRLPLIEGIADAGTHTIVVDGAEFNDDVSFTLDCEVAPLAGEAGAVADSCQSPGELTVGPAQRTFPVDTIRARDDFRLACGLDGSADLVHRLELEHTSFVSVTAAGSARGAIAIAPSCDVDAALACGAQVHQLLRPGTYYVMTESKPATFGRGELRVTGVDLQVACDAAPLVRSGTTQLPIPRETSRIGLSCNGTAGSHWTMRKVVLQARSRLVARVGRAQTRLALWRGCADEEILCRANGAVERAIDQVLDAGTYYLVVATRQTQPIDLEVDITRQ